MKAISLWQPWASLLAIGIKGNETRSWPTEHRGNIAIHAASFFWRNQVDDAALPALEILWQNRSQFPGYHGNVKDLYDSLPFGKIIGVQTLRDCTRAEFYTSLTKEEDELGDYSPGRYVWIMSKTPRPLVNPITLRGRQRLFNLPIDIEAQVRAQL